MSARRRAACALLALNLLAGVVQAEPGVSAQRVTVGMSAPLTGPLAPQGLAFRAGAQAAFDAVNAQGGVHGRELQFKARDDAGEPARALAQAQALLNEGDGVLALTGFFGAATFEAVLPTLTASSALLLGPASSAEAMPTNARRMLYLTRAGVREQVGAMLLHIDHLGIEQIALVAQSDSLGQTAWDTVHGQLASVAARPAAALRLPANDAGDALLMRTAQALRDSGARAVVLALEGPPALALLRAMRKAGALPAVYLLHDAWATLSAQGQLEELVGATVAQALPNTAQESVPVVADYRREIAKSGAAVGPAGMEGYLNARLLIDALRRCPREPLRSCVGEALDRRPIDVGGYRLQFDAQTHRGSRWVELGRVGRDGRLLR